MKNWEMNMNTEMVADLAAGAVGYLWDVADQVRDALQGEQAQKAAGAIRGALVDVCMALTSPRVAGAASAAAGAVAGAANAAVIGMLATVAWMAGALRLWWPVMALAAQAGAARALANLMGAGRGAAQLIGKAAGQLRQAAKAAAGQLRQATKAVAGRGRQITEGAAARIGAAWRFRAEVVRECR